MKKLLSFVFSIMLAFSLLSPTAKAWDPAGWYETFDELPQTVQEYIEYNYYSGTVSINKSSYESGYYYTNKNGGKDVFITFKKGEGTWNMCFYLDKNLQPMYNFIFELPKGYSIMDNIAITNGVNDYYFKLFNLSENNPDLCLTHISYHKDGKFVQIEPELFQIKVEGTGIDIEQRYAKELYVTISSVATGDKIGKTYDDLLDYINNYNINDNFAVVNNPNPEDRLNLRIAPNKNADYMGKYYNGTIVYCIKDEGDWVQVQIGSNTGYMLKKYLSFETKPITVEPAFPQLYPNFYEFEEIKLYDKRMKPTILYSKDYMYMKTTVLGIIGSGNDTYYHVIFNNGTDGYIHESQLTAGNG